MFRNFRSHSLIAYVTMSREIRSEADEMIMMEEAEKMA
jgi:hypothetical protein